MPARATDSQSTPNEPLLSGLGVSANEEAIYRSLLRNGPTELADLSPRTQLSIDALRRGLRRLEKLGMVSRLTGNRLRLIATPPHLAVDALVVRREAEIARARAGIDVLAGEVQHTGPASPDELLEVITGREAVRDSFMQFNLSAQEEVMALVKAPFAIDLSDEPATQDDALRRGIRARGIYDATAFDTTRLLEGTRRLIAKGEEARVGHVPVKLVIVDSKRALLPLTSADHGPDEMVAMVVQKSALLDALVSLFEMLWQTASPLIPAATDAEPSGDVADTEILGLLSAGLKDETIARQLGLSKRTLQRRLSDIFESVDARTRFQAGFRIGRGHLLDD